MSFLLGVKFVDTERLRSSSAIYKHTTHTHTRLTALSPGPPRWAGTRKAKPIWIILKQETVSGNSISWNICKSAPRSRQITTPTPHHSVFYRPDALPATQPTASKHWRHLQAHKMSAKAESEDVERFVWFALRTASADTKISVPVIPWFCRLTSRRICRNGR